MSNSDSKHTESASGGKDTASGGSDTASDGTDVVLDKYVREVKYRSPKTFRNWEKQDESELLHDEHAGIKNDFADLLNVPSDCNYFQFKSEKNWDSEAARNAFSCQKFFDLNLELLSHGLECLPYYERVMMDKNKLTQSDIERCDKKASEALEKYKIIQENFKKELEENEKLSNSFENLTGINWEEKTIAPPVAKPEPEKESAQEEVDSQFSPCGRYWLSHRTELQEKGDDSYLAQSSSSDESLELWLDTVLDD